MPNRWFAEEDLRDAIERSYSYSWADALRHLHMTVTGRNHKTLKRYAELWKISTDHFDPNVGRRRAMARRGLPLEQVLVRGSTFSRSQLKRRLFAEGLKKRECELCGQGEIWRGRRMALILDHINGVADDNRLENLQIVCPNCAATLDTHCARNGPRISRERTCLRCDRKFFARRPQQRYCSQECGMRWDRSHWKGVPKLDLRKVDRPPYEELIEAVDELGYSFVGRHFGVSDNAVRKWIRAYQREFERERAQAQADGGSPLSSATSSGG